MMKFKEKLLKKNQLHMSLRILKIFSCILLSVVALSCSKDNEEPEFEEEEEIEEIEEISNLVGTKWVLSNWDYSLGDDYIGLHDETYIFFFYSQTEGVFYYGRKDDYSDQGNSSERIACHFNYNVDSNEIILEYITDNFLGTTRLKLENDKLLANKFEYSKESISNTDYQWLNSIHGTTGSCSWYSDITKTIWIVGNGAMGDYTSNSSTPWVENSRIPNKVIICEGVTSIGSYAFANINITDVEMPDRSLKRVGDAAFKGSLIKSIWLSESTTSIGKEAFADCEYLKSINIPESIETIGEYAFSGCALDKYELEFGTNLRTIGNFAFEGGEASYLTFEEGVQRISNGAFLGNYCNISKELILPNSLTSVGSHVFEGTYKKIVIGEGITEIGEGAFVSGATSGEMYVNLSTPPSVGNNIIVDRTNWNSVESRWTLYVPKGCKSSYSGKSPWNKFKSIKEDSSLAGGNSNSGNNNGSSNGDETGQINGHEWVDLGLPSGLKWATCNVGASSPEEYGDYFAWGETSTKSSYTSDNCKTVNKSIGDISGNSSYDAARANWGGTWRMPTKAEFEELLDNCEWTWATQGGHNGIKVTSKKNGNSIFLPAAGSWCESSLNFADGGGDCWSSTPTSGNSQLAHHLHFNSGGLSTSWASRDFGYSVRAVSE